MRSLEELNSDLFCFEQNLEKISKALKVFETWNKHTAIKLAYGNYSVDILSRMRLEVEALLIAKRVMKSQIKRDIGGIEAVKSRIERLKETGTWPV